MNFLNRHYGKIWLTCAGITGIAWFRPVHDLLKAVLIAGLLAISLAWLLLPAQDAKRADAKETYGSQAAFLCDTCKYSYGNICTKPEKPNATECEDYRNAGSGT